MSKVLYQVSLEVKIRFTESEARITPGNLFNLRIDTFPYAPLALSLLELGLH